jgi:hypothetical protein
MQTSLHWISSFSLKPGFGEEVVFTALPAAAV